MEDLESGRIGVNQFSSKKRKLVDEATPLVEPGVWPADLSRKVPPDTLFFRPSTKKDEVVEPNVARATIIFGRVAQHGNKHATKMPPRINKDVGVSVAELYKWGLAYIGDKIVYKSTGSFSTCASLIRLIFFPT